MHYVEDALDKANKALLNLINSPDQISNIYLAINLMVDSIKKGGHIFACGNGGSLCDAMHFAEELTGRYRKNRPALPGIAISDASHIACIGNDFGYDEVFSRYLEANASSQDCLIAISTSGKSRNIIKAIQAAQHKGLRIIFLSGKENYAVTELCNVSIITSAGDWADRVQELHIKILHIFIEGIERSLFPENY